MLKSMIDFSWTLFLDRDGVINSRIFGGYVQKKEDFCFKDDVFDFLKFAHNHFHRIIVVTNQQGVGKGLMSVENLNEIHDYMIDSVVKNSGRIDKVYSAINLKDDINNIRKPLPFLGYEAQKDFPTIDFKKSIMIGDTNSDLLFGANLGMKTILVESKEEITERYDFKVKFLSELIF